MSDTVSDLASRAQAREEFAAQVKAVTIAAEAISKSRSGFEIHPTDRDAAAWVVDPKVFPRLAGLLGYVKAGGEEWAVRCGGNADLTRCMTRQVAERLVDDYARMGMGDTAVVRRAVGHGPWEVVTDAEQD